MNEIGEIGFLLLANLLFFGFLASIFWAIRSFFVNPSKSTKVNSSNLEQRIEIIDQKLDKIIKLLEDKENK